MDREKGDPANLKDNEYGVEVGPVERADGEQSTNATPIVRHLKHFWTTLTERAAIEARGVQPVPIEERTDRAFNIFTVWFCLSTNVLPVTIGMEGTITYQLSLRNAALVILFFTLLCSLSIAYLATLGPKTGMRQMVQARFSFGYYLVSIPVILNLASLTGFIIISSITAGLTLSSVNPGRLTPTVGIVIILVLSLLISFCGFRVLHVYERWAWIPALIALIVATGCGGIHLQDRSPVPPVTVQNVLSFAAQIAGFCMPCTAFASDFVTYMSPKTSSVKTFTYVFTAFFVPSVLLATLGAAMGASVSTNASWQQGYNSTSVGGVLAAMLAPAGGFGKFLVVILSLSILGNLTASMYSVSLNFQLLLPFFAKIPRAIYCIFITAITIPIAIRAATSFFDNLENFLGIVGYWPAAFVAIVGEENILFKKSVAEYDHRKWNRRHCLPSGLPAMAAGVLSFGLVIPCMSQVWYTGPVAKHTGDIGFEVAFAVTAILYPPLRYLELRLEKGRGSKPSHRDLPPASRELDTLGTK